MKFEQEVKKLIVFYKSRNLNIRPLNAEVFVESMRDWSEFMDLREVEEWFRLQQDNCKMKVKQIPLNSLKKWKISKNNSRISHETNNFFSVLGLRITETIAREVGKKGWDQPILKEKNNNGGIVGIIRKKINGIPHYLIEAKAEPGNPDLIQISPCFQATYSNINQAHGGRKPHLYQFFLNPKKNNFDILFNQPMSEDGGRLYKKKNRGMLIQAPIGQKIILNKRFVWLSLFQIKYLIKKKSWVNPHVRSIISQL